MVVFLEFKEDKYKDALLQFIKVFIKALDHHRVKTKNTLKTKSKFQKKSSRVFL